MNVEIFYLVIVCVLFILAISDLVVGVSNDAVNFLNSAIGSKAAPFYITMIVASVGVLLGATFSSGMMEVARNGIFRPEQFMFREIMLIFLAVMITDVVLLDLFNTFGMPTSTTVSLVFELLGSAVAISSIKIFQTSGQTLADLSTYINTSKVSAIVFSILASVFIGLIVGAIVQYLARLLFSFKVNKTIKYFGSLWGGVCTVLILYFIIFKGMKGSSLVPTELTDFLSANINSFMGITFVIASGLLMLLQYLFKVNPLKIIVLLGTFALAMAFAGNDLVNFIGVPMAGLSAFSIFQGSAGVAPDALNMQAMQGTVPTPEFILILSGIIMILTLWFSKRAKNVIKTTVNLSSQSNQEERFSSTPLSRSVVKMFVGISETIIRITPKKLRKIIAKRFKQPRNSDKDVAFDLVRASVNLMVASALIAFGTSLKLPLSTTYITFMVAMGTSLSDGAWGRENAVYRVTGVFTVIGGWFVTGVVAFTLSCIVASILYFGGWIAIIAIIGAVIFTMFRTHKMSKKNEQKEEIAISYLKNTTDHENIHDVILQDLSVLYPKITDIFGKCVDGLENESSKQLHKVSKSFYELDNITKQMKTRINETVLVIQERSLSNGHYYTQIVNYFRESLHSLSFVLESSSEHTDNRHRPLLKDQISELKLVGTHIENFYAHIAHIASSKQFEQLEDLQAEQNEIFLLLDNLNKSQLKRAKIGLCGTKNGLLYLRIISNTKNMILFSYLMAKSMRDFYDAKTLK